MHTPLDNSPLAATSLVPAGDDPVALVEITVDPAQAQTPHVALLHAVTDAIACGAQVIRLDVTRLPLVSRELGALVSARKRCQDGAVSLTLLVNADQAELLTVTELAHQFSYRVTEQAA